MSATFTKRYLIARGSSTFLNYLHLDTVLAALVIVFVIAGSLANSMGAVRTLGSSISRFSADEGTVSSRDAERATQILTPSMKAALDNVSQRYRVSAEALQPVFEAAQSAAPRRQLDPLLIIAVIAVESRFNPYSQSPMGAQGLMQIIPRYHQDKVPDMAPPKPFLDPVINVNIGAQILQEAIRRQGGLVEGLQYYGGVLDDDDKTYASKVLAEKLRLEQAPRRREATGR